MIGVSEQHLASVVVKWLQAEDWDVYQEVQLGGDRADIVARRGRVLHVVEVKKTFSLALIGQGLGWIGHAHLVSVAAPVPPGARGTGVARRLGLGIIDVQPNGWAHLLARPSFLRQISPRLSESLREEHKTFAPAGNATSSFYSSFKATCANVARWTAQNPGGKLRDCIEAIRHHYASDASARSSLVTWIERGKVDGVRLARERDAMRLYPDPSRRA